MVVSVDPAGIHDAGGGVEHTLARLRRECADRGDATARVDAQVVARRACTFPRQPGHDRGGVTDQHSVSLTGGWLLRLQERQDH
jgi:hypothetical protein